MQKTLKKSISILLSILMIVSLFVAVPVTASAEVVTDEYVANIGDTFDSDHSTIWFDMYAVTLKGGTYTHNDQVVTDDITFGDPEQCSGADGAYIEMGGSFVHGEDVYEPVDKNGDPSTWYVIGKSDGDDGKFYLVLGGYDPNAAPTYTVTWQDWDDTLLKTEVLAEGATPTYTGTTPEKAQDAHYTYTFSGWNDGQTTYGLSDTLPAVSGDVTYTATYTATAKPITSDELYKGLVIDAGTQIRFLMKSIGSEWQTISLQVYLDGEKVKDLQVQEASTTEPDRYYTPTKKCIVESYTYNRPSGSNQHTEHILRLKSVYDVTWKNDDGTELEKDENVVVGTTPTYDGEAPTKAEDEQNTYTFSGWNDGQTTYGLSDTLPAVSGDVTYTATFTATKKPISSTDLHVGDVIDKDNTIKFIIIKSGEDWRTVNLSVYLDGTLVKELVTQYVSKTEPDRYYTTTKNV